MFLLYYVYMYLLSDQVQISFCVYANFACEQKAKFARVSIYLIVLNTSASSASALYSVGLVTALYTGERERHCLVTPCESVSEALDCFSTNNLCIQLVPFDHSFYKK